MGGVAGSAGLFSTADDLSIYARMLLNGGALDGVRILGEKSVQEMTASQSPAGGSRARGYGWDKGAQHGFSLFSAGAYGHLGYTGTMIWIDPASAVYAIVLTNRSYPDGKGDAAHLRKSLVETLTQAIHRPGQAAGARRD
jgi:CubicO group peptidase (beta-lactamase class C family)